MGLNSLIEKIEVLPYERRPLTPEEVKGLDQYYKIGTTYNSNALEGNSLTLTETKILIEDDIHPFTDGNGRTARILMNLN